MKKIVILILLFTISLVINGQKFHLRSGVGFSSLNWYESQMTANLSIQLTYQKKESHVLFFGELKTLGNAFDSKVDPSKYEFIPYMNSNGQPSNNDLDINQLSSYYRGGSAEVGLQLNQYHRNPKVHLFPEFSLYSISLARKISSNKTNYVEEEKYALHGLTGGFGLQVPGKVKISVKTKLFLPVLTNFTLYGRYVGVPYETSNQEINICYRNSAEISYKKFNLVIDFDSYHLGKSENLKSKTIASSQDNMLSVYLNYIF
jgi:hypothetical protein